MIIGISGVAGAGKDEASNYIVDKYDFVKIAFADKIKRILADLYGLSYNQLWGESKNRSIYDPRYKVPNSDEYLTARLGAQAFGDCGRSLYENTWVNYTFKQIEQLEKSYFLDYEDYRGIYTNYLNPGRKDIIISDCRYINEMNRIKEMGGKVIRIKKTVVPLKGNAGKHSSETNQITILDNYFDHIIYNDYALDDLYSQMDEFMALNT